MTFKTLTLDDRSVFREQELRRPLVTSDANFSNMFIWQGFYHFSWTRFHDCLCVISNPENGTPFALPPLGQGDQLAAAEFLAEQMTEPKLSRVPEDLAKIIAEAHPDWTIQDDIDNFDYVYSAEKLINLSGRRMHQKKNHYNNFIQNNHFELLEVTEGLHDQLAEVEAKWLVSKTEKIGADSHLQMEKEAVHLLLENFRTLEVCGLAIKINDRIEAFTLGESLNEETALIHVEKGNPEIRGIYVALCSFFCKNNFSDKIYINREQDLGLPGLRKSKESLKPAYMAKKFNVFPK
ncbi:MAG: phosphatidylglycerol lysyltransferase domain-containing protein [Deltaproteobacteria bacterium]|nr:phosphatidylglycerol lysyltransferase domain-containing protein [Deltaproteobacteria bacterium]